MWTIDFKGQFKTRDGIYCYPLTVLDNYSRYLLACTALHDVKTRVILPDVWALETDDAAADDVSGDPTVHATEPVLGVDHAGNVTLVWRKRATGAARRFDAVSRRLLAGTSDWTEQTRIETRDIGSVEWPSLGVGSDGTVVAVWDYTVEADVWAAVLR